MQRLLRATAALVLAATVGACGTSSDGSRPDARPAGERVSPAETGPPAAPEAGETPTAAPSSSAPASSAPPVTSAPPSSPAASPRTVAPPNFGIPVKVGSATQVVTVRASGSYATVTAWQQDNGKWRVLRTMKGRVGANGVTNGATRRQGTSTTPTGTYTMTEAFGIKADPGTRLPYTRVGSDHFWVQDNNSRYYNQMRRGAQGGFDTTSPENAANGSERLAAHVPAYHYSIVIDFNRDPAVRGRGAGIFLHVNGSGATAGCVSVPETDMLWLMRWVDPARSPVIAIA